MSTRTLAPRKYLFPFEYVKDQNGTAAAIRCGYSARTAASQGSRLLKDAKVRAEIDRLTAERNARAAVTADRILEEVDLLATSDIGDVLDFSGDVVRFKVPSEIPERARRMISAIKVKEYVEGRGDDAEPVRVTEFKIWDKPAALRLAMQHRKMLTDRHELTGKDGAPLPTMITVTLKRPDDSGG